MAIRLRRLTFRWAAASAILFAVACAGAPAGTTGNGDGAPTIEMAALDRATSAATRTPWLEIITPDPEETLAPMFQSEQQVIDFVTMQLGGIADIAEVYAKRTTYGAFSTMTFGPGAVWPVHPPAYTPEVQESQRPDSPMGRSAVWVAGVRTTEPVDCDLALARMGAPPSGQSGCNGTEFYVVYDELGNAAEVGVLVGVDENGVSGPNFLWQLADIATLPAP